MTEEEWLTCREVDDLFEHVGPFVSTRKTRLLGCACVRRAWEWGLEEPAPEAVHVAEAFADGQATTEDLARVAGDMSAWRRHEEPYRPYPRTCELTESLASPEACDWLDDLVAFTSDMHIANEPEWGAIAGFAHDIFGNPFRPIAFDPAWRTEAAVGIASGIYEERAFERMPILADALQEAGCENADVLAHCREPGVHVRGCWVVDLVLGKS